MYRSVAAGMRMSMLPSVSTPSVALRSRLVALSRKPELSVCGRDAGAALGKQIEGECNCCGCRRGRAVAVRVCGRRRWQCVDGQCAGAGTLHTPGRGRPLFTTTHPVNGAGGVLVEHLRALVVRAWV